MVGPTKDRRLRGRGLLVGLGLVLPILIALGPAVNVDQGQRTAPILWLEVGIVVLVAHLTLSRMWTEPEWGPAIVAIAIGPLVPAVLISPDIETALVTAVHLSAGLLGGWALASVWFRLRLGTWTAVDTGFAIAGVIVALQLFWLLQTSDLGTFHQVSELSWGRSNYVAAVLIVLGLAVWGRVRACKVNAVALAVPVTMWSGALATLSRGAVVSLVIAPVVTALIGLRSKRRFRMGRIALVVAVLLVGLAGFNQLSSLRAESTSAAHIADNVTQRQQLWAVSWQMFQQAPLSGSGLGSLREVSRDRLGVEETYAHNIELSLLQQAGLLGLPYLSVLAVCTWTALGRGGRPELRAAIVAGIVAAQSEPVFEGTVGGAVLWSLIFCSYFTARSVSSRPASRQRFSRRDRTSGLEAVAATPAKERGV